MTSLLDLRVALNEYPLPPLGGDKGDRGSLVLVAGGRACPGAAVLAANAAFRAGAGRVQVASHPTVAAAIGIAVPELLVVGWDVADAVPDALRRLLDGADAVLVGPGLDADAGAAARAVAEWVPTDVPLVLDALALPAAPDLAADRHLLVLPNESEAEELAGSSADGSAGPEALARSLAARLGSVVAVRGADTVVVGDGRAFHRRGDPGLGAAGSGDVLVGFAAGLATRHLPDLVATAWAVAAHSRAGAILGGGRPNPGYLARDLLDVLPVAVDQLLDELGERSLPSRR